MKKSISAILMAGLMLAAVLSALSVNAACSGHQQAVGGSRSNGNGYNFWIEKVTYETDPSNPDITIFTVSVGAEGLTAGGSYHPNVESRVNGQLHDMNYVAFEEDGIQTCQLNGGFIDFSEDLVEIKVDPNNDYPETNENDNLWTLNGDDDKPDFIVSTLKHTYVGGPLKGAHLIEVGISNEVGYFENPDQIYIKVLVTFPGGEEELSFPYIGSGEQDTVEFFPVDENGDPVSLKKGDKITAIVDPDNEIPESNLEGNAEDNNEATITVEKSRAKSTIVNILENLLNKFNWPFPMLRYFLGL